MGRERVVKVDSDLVKKIEELIKKNKFLYTSKKQVVNLALVEFLTSISWKEKQNQSIKSKFNLIKGRKKEAR